MADYYLDFKCKCGGNLGVYINWNTGDETVHCENDCAIDIDWLNNKQNGGK